MPFAASCSLPSFLLSFLFICIISLFPRYLQKKKILSSIGIGILISAVAALASYVLLRYFIESGRIYDMDEGGRHGRSTAPIVLMVMTMIGMLCGSVALVMNGFINWFNEIKLKQNLREKNVEMELALIKKQLDPHLLFNTINNIDALILRDAVAASDYLNQLSDIMRFVLYETKAEKIPLSREMEYIEKYIALQRIRTMNENYVQFIVNGSTEGHFIAPMIFIPFIENALHTHNKKLENAIRVEITINEDSVELNCVNRNDPRPLQQGIGGLGNELIQKRLNLIYPGKHTLDIQNNKEQYQVYLNIHHG
ncbi:MAG: histidine kinase [Bacteroidetes bacterium]|nr:histidine kinase [Bacteroidota bacterium]